MFMAGANSIFTGDRLLTTSNPEFDADKVIDAYAQNLSCLVFVKRAFFAALYEPTLFDLLHEVIHSVESGRRQRTGGDSSGCIQPCSAPIVRAVRTRWLARGYVLISNI